jgi:hypothetical protein
MHNHVIDDDFVMRRAKHCGKFLIQAADQVATFEVAEIAELDIRLRGQIGRAERIGMNGRASDIADEKNVVRAKSEHTSGLERTGSAASRGAFSGCRGATKQSQPDGGDSGKSQDVPPCVGARDLDARS